MMTKEKKWKKLWKALPLKDKIIVICLLPILMFREFLSDGYSAKKKLRSDIMALSIRCPKCKRKISKVTADQITHIRQDVHLENWDEEFGSDDCEEIQEDDIQFYCPYCGAKIADNEKELNKLINELLNDKRKKVVK